jgi:O-antigen/teichoic acid export membrane protein
VAIYTADLAAVSAGLLGVRLIGLAAHWAACLQTLPVLARPRRPDRVLFRPLIAFGGWLTVTNVVGPLMTHLDRFVIGARFDLAAVAHYTTPYELLTRLWLVPFALTTNLFPTFSGGSARRSEASAQLMLRSIAVVFGLTLPVVVFAIAYAREGLGVWLSEEFASHSYRVAQWLAAGVMINSMAQVPSSFVQGAGRPDWIAKLHLLELPIYLLGLWWALDAVGIVGAAMAWTARVSLDALALLWMARAASPTAIRYPSRLGLAVALACASLVCLAMTESMPVRSFVALGAIGVPALLLWRVWFDSAERINPQAER